MWAGGAVTLVKGGNTGLREEGMKKEDGWEGLGVGVGVMIFNMSQNQNINFPGTNLHGNLFSGAQ